jgi:excisionase family DNA binding protein
VGRLKPSQPLKPSQTIRPPTCPNVDWDGWDGWDGFPTESVHRKLPGTERTSPRVSTTIMGGPILLTVEQAAGRIGVGRTTMFALIRTGEVHSVRIGRLRRVRVADLEAYANSLSASDAA